ncbi:MAG TPA: YIP1 family protein [Gemmatimonadaceae bacterium]|nr:YIP1 family protein [Gemmatimonadaceae bacterium]
MDSPNAMHPDAPPAVQDKTSVWEDFLDIFYAPSQVFGRRANGNFWIPLLVVTVLLALLGFANRHVVEPIFDAEFQRNMATAMKNNPQLTPAMLEKSRSVGLIAAQIGAVVFVPIIVVISGFVAWVGAKLVGTKISWNAALVVAAYAAVPRVLQGVVISIQGLLMDPSAFVSRFSIEIGPARFFNADTVSPIVGVLLDRFELFSLWGVVLLTIGVAVIGKVPKAKAWALGIGFWVVMMLPSLIGAWRAS